jgi:hypothetical protein
MLKTDIKVQCESWKGYKKTPKEMEKSVIWGHNEWGD